MCRSINPKGRQYIHLCRSNQQKSPGGLTMPDWPVFHSFVYNETMWSMLNVNLSYKPPSSWRILFHYGGRSSHFSCLITFKSLVISVGGFRTDIILQVILTPKQVLPNGQLWLKIKGGVMGYFVHAPIYMNIPYWQTVIRSIYKIRRPEQPHSPIFRYERYPQGPAPWPHDI